MNLNISDRVFVVDGEEVEIQSFFISGSKVNAVVLDMIRGNKVNLYATTTSFIDWVDSLTSE